jgi:hypothetical protein
MEDQKSAVFTLLRDLGGILTKPISLPGGRPSKDRIRNEAIKRLAKSGALKPSQDTVQPAYRKITFTLEGEVRTGKDTLYSIDGEDFDMDDSTFMFGELRVGSQAIVKGHLLAGNIRHATSVKITQVAK